MRIEDIQDTDLRSWAQTYCSERLAEMRSQKASSEFVAWVWRHFNEMDWESFRALQELRPQAKERFHDDETQKAVLDFLETLPKVERSGIVYRAPWTLAREATALRKLLGIPEPEPRRCKIEVVDFSA